MDPQWGFTVCRFLAIGASFITFISLLATWYYSSKLEEQKNGTITTLVAKTKTNEADLATKDRQIVELEETAQRLRRGRSVVFYSDGQKVVTTGPGHMNLITDGPEVQVFNQMMTLQERQDFPALFALAEAEIAKLGPPWLSPFLFKGVALINLGRREEGIDVLRFVAREAPDDEDFYKQAAKFLKELGVEP
jgi:hypothetical protein